MASEKMSPISAILHELKRHHENSMAAKRLLDDRIRRQFIEIGWRSENSSIGALCDLLEIIAIPEEERSTVIMAVSELAATRGSHSMLDGLLESLQRP